MTAAHSRLVATGLLLSCWSLAAQAQLTGGIQLGPVTAYPGLGISIGYDDNVALGSDGVDQRIESWFLVLSPAIRFEAGSKRSLYSLEIAMDIAEYEASPFDDYNDLKLTGGWEYDPTIRSTLAINAGYTEGHTRRGEGVRDFLLDRTLEREVDEYEQRSIDARYSYGASGARGRVDLTAGMSYFDYQNNLELTEIGNNDSRRLGLGFNWRMAPKTTLLTIARYSDYDFDVSDRDNDQLFYGFGVEWDATAKTSGRLELGYLEKTFDNPENPSYSGESWQASVDWAVKDYSVFQFGTGRTASEAFGESTFLVRDYYEVAWRHQWRSRLGSTIDVGYSQENQDPGSRDDDFWSIGASVNYEFRRWLLVGLGLKHFERDSSEDTADYDRNEVLLSLEFRL